jgi:hypothetical protein
MHSLYKLHDDVKDKPMELELSWVCDESKRYARHRPSWVASGICLVLTSWAGWCGSSSYRMVPECGGLASSLVLCHRKHVFVPEELRDEAFKAAVAAKEAAEMDSDEDDA